MTKNSLITLYCIVDDFIHRFLETSAEKKNLALYYGRREPKRRNSGCQEHSHNPMNSGGFGQNHRHPHQKYGTK